MKTLRLAAAIAVLLPGLTVASEEVQDMSDPLAVYTQVGAGSTNKGLNFKIGQVFDTGNEETMGMYTFELKGLGGDTLGWENGSNDSIDSIRLRKANVNVVEGRGMMLDAAYDFNNEFGSLSYNVVQATPAFGPIQLYPLAGAGASFGNNVIGDNGDVVSGYSMPGIFAVVGMYSRIEITDRIWANYNPMWKTTLSGSEVYKENGIAGDSSALFHEVAVSYQFTPRFNLRYFANWHSADGSSNTDHRIEFNYQL